MYQRGLFYIFLLLVVLLVALILSHAQTILLNIFSLRNQADITNIRYRD